MDGHFLAKAQVGISPVTELQGAIAGSTLRYRSALNGIVGEWLFDAAEDHLAKALAYLDNETAVEMKQNSIAFEIEKGDRAAAEAKLGALALSDPGSADFVTYNSILMKLYENTYGVYSLIDQPELAEAVMELTATEGDDQIWRQAYLMREMAFGASYNFEWDWPENTTKRGSFELEETLEAIPLVNFYPNPAQDRIFFDA